MSEPTFGTIAQHWAHYLERDIPPQAPAVQVMAMKRAFAAGAISGLQLALIVGREKNPKKCADDLAAHIEGIKTLDRSAA